jgi:predicted sulfurtransferase
MTYTHKCATCNIPLTEDYLLCSSTENDQLWLVCSAQCAADLAQYAGPHQQVPITPATDESPEE